MQKPRFYQYLYFQMLVGICLGVVLGHFWSEVAIKFKPISDGFVKLIRMMLAPILFVTIVSGIAKLKKPKKVEILELRHFLILK